MMLPSIDGMLRILTLHQVMLNLTCIAVQHFEIYLKLNNGDILASGQFVSRGLLEMLVYSGERLRLLHLLSLASPILQNEY